MSKEPIILIVDDEKNTREGIRDYLQGDFDVYLASDAAAALQVLKNEAVDLMVTDLRLGKVDGMELIAQALALPKAPVCIMMTAYGSVDTAVEAMKQGAYDFVTKPVNMERMELLIRRALREKNMQRENTELRQRIGQVVGIENMIGSSPVIVSVFDKIRQVASSRATVLIEGESGTGKELAAHAIHQLSPRADEKFVAVHCAALSPQLLESELFGHERGAFTGATERRIGRFEQARGGTLFLDEIGEIDSSTQVKILRVLGEKNFERVGGNTTLQADVRLLTATNKNLETMVQEGTFREDLYFRLNVVRITMPPLRDRREDIPLLVNSFLKTAAEENGKSFRPCAPEAIVALQAYAWPGNVRELRAAVEHGVVMARGAEIHPADLPNTVIAHLEKTDLLPLSSPSEDTLNLQHHEIALIKQALQETAGNRTEAAKKLGISRRTLHRRLSQLQLT
ncbi:MAG: sigma-54-dependent transcriptional regulator [Chthoniobacterales bacterium]